MTILSNRKYSDRDYRPSSGSFALAQDEGRPPS